MLNKITLTSQLDYLVFNVLTSQLNSLTQGCSAERLKHVFNKKCTLTQVTE